MEIALGILEYPANVGYDFARYVSVALGALIFLLALYLRVTKQPLFVVPGDDDRFFGIMFFQAFAVLSGLHNQGKPFTLYLLPLILAGNFFILRGITKRLRNDGHDD